jgi:hypothetical protein
MTCCTASNSYAPTDSLYSYTVTPFWVSRNKRLQLNAYTQALSAYGPALAVLMGDSIRYFIKLLLFNDAIGIETI